MPNRSHRRSNRALDSVRRLPVLSCALTGLASVLTLSTSVAAPSPHPNPFAAQDEARVRQRGDVRKLPEPLKRALGELAEEPHSYLPLTAFAEADKPSQLFQYYLLDTRNFQPNVFTTAIPGINDAAIPTAARPGAPSGRGSSSLHTSLIHC